ncbi:hypothetical protein Glove_187g41 [Diversispora epigaea]|uniref:mRNA export factor GLE1 n=1 Tax=Diversispora epigaea TaxID=1348612 RepID=A0A397ILX7_9GLOM|nr:hypothetical protein Glove_187g41 [Diversispora epigaea]
MKLEREEEEQIKKQEEQIIRQEEAAKRAYLEAENEKTRRIIEEQKRREEEQRKRMEAIELEKLRKQKEEEERRKRVEEEEEERRRRRALEEEEKRRRAIEEEEAKRKKKLVEAAATATEAEKKKKQENELSRVINEANSNKPFSTDGALKEQEFYINIYKRIKDNLSKKADLKSQSYEVRKTIRLKLNVLTNKREEIVKIATEIDKILKQHSNSLLYYYLLNFLAKDMRRHAEIDVMSNEAAAFPLAQVCVLITSQHSEFINFVIVRLIRKCFYILPRYFVPENGKSIEDYKKFVGYRNSENDESYIQRMCAYVAFYCAIAQTDSIIPNVKNPYYVDHIWKYIARLMNMRQIKITPYLLYTCLKITAYEIHRAFGDTAFNLFAVIYDSYIANPPPEIQMLSSTSPSAMSRLKTLLEEASERGGKFNQPEGKFPS